MTHNASDFASRALASQAKPQREAKSQAFRIARFRKHADFSHPSQHRRIFAATFVALFLWIQSNLRGFRIASILGTFWHRLRFGTARSESHRTSRWHRAIRATKLLIHKWYFFFEGVVYKLCEPKRAAKYRVLPSDWTLWLYQISWC